MARGRLRVYLGAAPGVGKTYEMLLEGHRQRRQGVDCVIGFVEPHGRRATQELVDGLEVMPRRYVRHRGGVLPEMDVDAVLARRPQLTLVDELAHTNAPGSRNPKRWQDVQELLEAGIDVLTTLNIQHLESLGDVLTEMTGVEQRETVPDAVVRQADQQRNECQVQHGRPPTIVSSAGDDGTTTPPDTTAGYTVSPCGPGCAAGRRDCI